MTSQLRTLNPKSARRVLVTGATGFVGRRLLERLDPQTRVVVLTRDAAKAKAAWRTFQPDVFAWNPETELAPAEAFESVDAIFHLAGEPVAEGRWTAAKRIRLRESRLAGTRHLVETLAKLPKRPPVLVSASAVGFYGSRGDDLLDESAPPPETLDFLAEICVGWEREAERARELGVRVATVRVGIVLGPGGGALSKMLLPFKLGVGSPLGNGRQWMPWIHRDDLVSLMFFAAEHTGIRGPLNGTAPQPVTNREFTKTLGRVLHRPTFFPPVPGFMLKLLLGDFGSVLLTSQRAVPKAAQDAGFSFQYPTLEPALKNILG